MWRRWKSHRLQHEANQTSKNNRRTLRQPNAVDNEVKLYNTAANTEAASRLQLSLINDWQHDISKTMKMQWPHITHLHLFYNHKLKAKRSKSFTSHQVKVGSVYCPLVDSNSRIEEITMMALALQSGVITHHSVTLRRFLTAVRCLDNFCSCFLSARRSHILIPILQVKTLMEEPTGRITLSRDKISHTKGEHSL